MPEPKKGAAQTLYNGPPDKGGKIQRAGCLIRRLTDCYKCLAFDISLMMSAHSNLSYFSKVSNYTI